MITLNLYYTGKPGAAKAFAEEMEASGTAAQIRQEPGNLRYEYFQPVNDPDTILLVDSWTDQAAIDIHHATPMMAAIAALREKYDLHMHAERYISEDLGTDGKFIRK
ncbi:antibiotic biosynthesis monooxygenase [Clostridiales bacterium]|nr:antibiotic biosynthesis monooxygenase [Clostridiales bacterium]